MSLTAGGSAQIASDPAAQITVVVHGLLHDRSKSTAAQTVLSDYVKLGDSLWPTLNGSYVIVVLDQARGEIQVVTDRLNSRKAYWSEDDGGWWLSTSLNRHPTQGIKVDPAGVGSVLTSGVAYSGLTPFRGIHTLNRASIHSFSAEDRGSRTYWSYSLTSENANTPRAELRNRMADLLRGAVERRAQSSDGPIYISLSGGYDSKSIAAFLRRFVGDPNRLRAITYHHGPRIGDTDANAAEQAALMLGIPHETRPLYRGDIVALIAANARRGQGMARFCEESDFWEDLGPQMAVDEANSLFVGEMPGESLRRRTDGTPSEMLGLVHVFPPSIIEWFLERIEPDAATAIRAGWGASFSELVERVPNEPDYRDAQHVMYLDQRVSNALMLWRECFQMPFVHVMNPYLDNDILDFVRTLPVDLRVGKTLYKEAISGAFPQLFELPIAKGGSNAPDWGQELLRSRYEIQEWVRSRPSRLDDLISPESVLSLLDEGHRELTRNLDSLSAKARRLAKSSSLVRRAVRSAKPRTLGAIPNRIPWHRLAIRLLVLRESLSVSDEGSETHSPTG